MGECTNHCPLHVLCPLKKARVDLERAYDERSHELHTTLGKGLRFLEPAPRHLDTLSFARDVLRHTIDHELCEGVAKQDRVRTLGLRGMLPVCTLNKEKFAILTEMIRALREEGYYDGNETINGAGLYDQNPIARFLNKPKTGGQDGGAAGEPWVLYFTDAEIEEMKHSPVLPGEWPAVPPANSKVTETAL